MAPRPTRSRVERLWSRETGPADVALRLPLFCAAGVFRAAVAVRNLWWRWRALAPPIRTISVGNLTVGGNAKTPFALFLANRLRRRGLKVAIVSRGWRRTKSRLRATLVADGGRLLVAPEQAGDEPAMMAHAFAGPIVVARRRIDALRLLAESGAADIAVLDDAFQHTRLRRDLDLVLVGRERGFGNGWMLPAGPMREPLGALGRADAVVLVSADRGAASALSASQTAALERMPILLHAELRARALMTPERGIWRETSAVLGGRRVVAVCGLAASAGFYALLRALDTELVATLEYPDHYAYTQADWQIIAAAAREADLIVTTEKDLIKLERFPFPRDSLYALRLEVSMSDTDAAVLDRLIEERIAPAPSAPCDKTPTEEASRDAG